jgi:hypothetical protein
VPEWLAASHILVLSTIPLPIISACKVNLGQSFDECFGLLFGGTIDKTLIKYHHPDKTTDIIILFRISQQFFGFKNL